MSGTGSLREVFEQLDAAFAALAEVDLHSLTGVEVRELTVASQRMRSQADAACVRAAGALDVSRAWAPEGARSAAAWMQWRCRIDKPRASAALACARELRHMPATEAALVAGELTTDHVRLLAKARRAAPHAFAADEARLLESATTLWVRQLAQVISYWIQAHAPDKAEEDAAEAFDRRAAHASATFEGTVVVDAILDPVGGAMFLRELQRLEQQLFEADWAAAREHHGPAATIEHLARTPAQRRADAMALMARRSAAKPADAKEARVLLHVLAGHRSVERLCELSNGTVVAPGRLVPLLDKTDVERVIFGGPSKVIDVGVRRRFFTGATRTAVQVRDRGCTHPSCDTPLDRCEVDHIHPYDAGGPTTQANGQCQCPHHNRLKGNRPPPPAA